MPDLALTASQKERYRICTKTILDSLESQFDGGIALIEVRDHKLYRGEFSTFEDYCKEVLKISRTRAYQLIEAAEVKESLPEKVSEKIVNENQARALADVPENQRAAVIREAAKTGKVTADSIEAAASKMSKTVDTDRPIESGGSTKTTAPQRPLDTTIELDRIGRAIPDALLEAWKDHSAQEILTHLSHAKAALDRIMRDRTISWVEVNLSGVLVDLQKVWVEVERAKPYALCPYCQGTNRKNCTRCKTWGFFSEYSWKTAVTKDMKNIIVKGAQNAASRLSNRV